MTFNDAKAALKALAGGKYHSIKFEVNEYEGGDIRPACGVYIDGFGHVSECANFEIALANMEAKIQQKDNPQLVEEMTLDVNMLSLILEESNKELP